MLTAASRQATVPACRGGDFHSSFSPVSAPMTKVVWASMRSGAWIAEASSSSTELASSAAVPPKRRAWPAASTATTPSTRGISSSTAVMTQSTTALSCDISGGSSSVPSTTKPIHSGAIAYDSAPVTNIARCAGRQPGSATRRAFCRLPWHQRRSRCSSASRLGGYCSQEPSSCGASQTS
ncbi:hypothetical protein RBXJA2T_08825 [Rubrivivax benzoatilyticus JA2 = ATCC BAA-35]|nr:hypothetical protein RBXJA2T_08825 [Rubrivivax benzoatilyticus JA2 = ATCC BAA-35]